MHIEDDEPPIKSHPASKEYRDNYDTIDWGPPDERRALPRGTECLDCGAKPPAQCDDEIHCTIKSYANFEKPVAYGVIEGVEKPAYYAHPVTWYNTANESADVERIEAQLGAALNPNADEHEAGYRSGRGMAYFYEDVLPGCACCVLRAFDDGKIGAGVYGEAEWFLERGLPVYEIDSLDIVSFDDDRTRRLTVEETRARIKAGQR